VWASVRALGPLYAAGDEYSLEHADSRLSAKLNELGKRDWTKHAKAEPEEKQAPETPEPAIAVKPRQPIERPDPLAAYRDQRTTIVPEPEAE
jgi:hypothetical protein